MSQRLRWARFLQMPEPEPPEAEPDVEPKRSRGHLRLQFPALVMDLWERGTGHTGHHAGHAGHAEHEEAQVQHVGHREMTHLEHHHGSHEDSMSDLGLALISSGTTIFLAMISAIFAMRLFREMLRPQAAGGAQGGQGDMQGVLQLEVPGVQPFRPFSGQGHRLIMEADKDDASGGAAASGEREPR